MRSFLKRCLNSAIRRIGFARLYTLKKRLEKYEKLHDNFMKLFISYPGILLYFEQAAHEKILFPHTPKHLHMTSCEVQRLYHAFMHMGGKRADSN